MSINHNICWNTVIYIYCVLRGQHTLVLICTSSASEVSLGIFIWSCTCAAGLTAKWCYLFHVLSTCIAEQQVKLELYHILLRGGGSHIFSKTVFNSRPPRSRSRTILVDGLKNSSLGHVIVVYADDIRVNSNFCQKYAK